MFSIELILSADVEDAEPPRSALEAQQWAPPPAPGPTLRDRIERREREAGLRCSDPSCGIGPSDEEPFVEVPQEAHRLVGPLDDGGWAACAHTFHPACLVSAQHARESVFSASGVEDDATVKVVCGLCTTGASTGVSGRREI
ncbi:hypothetical protein B0H13DRAFT_1591254 [Mycena leptocephala]|nr:hypothetical protein B0H13DRAFT_1591254 [Mycena leptocephala]